MKKIEQLYAIKLMSLSNFSGFYLFIFLQFLPILCKNVVIWGKSLWKITKKWSSCEQTEWTNGPKQSHFLRSFLLAETYNKGCFPW